MTFGVQAAAWMGGAVFAVEDGQIPPVVQPEVGWLQWVLIASWLLSPLWLAAWAWMLWHCYRHEPDREFWFWVMIFIPPAALIYFLTRFLPGQGMGAGMPKGLKRWSRGREIEQLEVAARQIGNPHQWVQLGDALREVGQFADAAEAYDKAIAKEPDNIQALWGAGIANLEQQQFAIAREHLEKGLALKPDYKFGDLSLAYGQALGELGEIEPAAEHLRQHVKRWRHPEGLYLLATIEMELGHPDEARNHLEGLLWDITGSPKAIARKQSRWKSRATKLLKELPPAL